MYLVAEFRDLLARRCVDILQPDCSHAGNVVTLSAVRAEERLNMGLIMGLVMVGNVG